MKIARIDPILLSYPLPEPLTLRYFGGERTIFKRDAMVIRVETDRGRVGWAPGQGSESAAAAIRDTIAPFLLGRPIAEPDALRVHFTLACADATARKAYGAVEMALYDLKAQALGLPVSEVIGGRVRDSIALYASAGMYMSPEAYAEEAAAVESLGYAAYKMRPGIGPDEDLRAVELMRDACGRLELMVDAHTWWRMGDRNYDLATVERIAEGMAEFDVTWLEEPLPPSDHQAYADLRSRVSVPLAGGEHEATLEGLIELTASGCVDFVQADPVCQGGFSTIRRLLAEVERRESHFAFHCWGTDFEVLAAAHLGICWEQPVVPWLEQAVYRRDGVPVMYPFPLAHEILRDPLPVRDGELVVPRETGWGVAINEAVLERYPWIPGPWSRFRLISPPGEWAVTGDHSVQWAPPQQS